jgi:hypothetical protein
MRPPFEKRRDFIVGMLTAALISLIFWGSISLWYSGRPDTAYKFTPVLILWAMPIHLGLLSIAAIRFRANIKRLDGSICGGAIAFILDLAAMWSSGFVIFNTFSVPLDTILLLSQILFVWVSILILFLFI